MIDTVEVVSRTYRDSVFLMQLTDRIAGCRGVERVLVSMATDLNLELAAGMGFALPAAAGPDDLLIAIRALDERAMAEAKDEAAAGLAASVQTAPGAAAFLEPPPPRTARAAGHAVGAGIALVSVPGPHAFVEAMDALAGGMHVMVFSDHVALGDEIRLKDDAAARGLFVMGPDCGTAIVHGVGLGFANASSPGPVGIVGASGTGIQQLVALLDDAGVGVRHAIGTGSRDLSAEVAGRATLRAISALDAAPDVDVIAVVSKPAAPATAAAIEAALERCETPTVSALLGVPGVTLEGASRRLLGLLGIEAPDPASWVPARRPTARPGNLRGLFSGGTLRDEARTIATPVLGPIATAPDGTGHRFVDYGGDEYTAGRAHPMIDLRIRLDAMAAANADPSTGVVLLDVVLGYGAHPDPATELAPAVVDASAAGVPVVVSLCGTRNDPQGREGQAGKLVDAGATVFLSNAAAARYATALVEETRA